MQCFNCKEYGHFAKECRKSKRVKDYSYYKKKMMLFKKEEKGVPLNVEQSDWLQDTNEEPDEQELEEHYMYMAKIQEVLQVTDDNFGPTYDTKPLEHVPNDIEYNVFAKDKQHSKQPKTFNDTYVMETIDSNVIPDHSDMCNNEFEDDQNADDNDEDECVKLSNLIANSKLDIDENKKIQKQLRKANATLTHELNESKSALTESNDIRDRCRSTLHQKEVELEKYISYKNCQLEKEEIEQKNVALINQGSLENIRYDLLQKEKEQLQKDFKISQDKDIDKIIALENQVKVLNDVIYKINQSVQTIHMLDPNPSSYYNGRSSFVNPMYLKKAQSKNPCLYKVPYEKYDLANIFAPNCEETLILEDKNRSKLNKGKVKPYDYTY
ncbi:integrase, catalytic region, zinc finger, CCHC-type containing protein [Tanacetum coccineum]